MQYSDDDKHTLTAVQRYIFFPLDQHTTDIGGISTVLLIFPKFQSYEYFPTMIMILNYFPPPRDTTYTTCITENYIHVALICVVQQR